MNSTVRYLLYLICAVQLFFAVGFYFQWPIATGIWPFPGTTPLTYIFVASIFAAAAASTLWAVASGHYGALAGIGLDYLTIMAPLSIFTLLLGVRDGNNGFVLLGIACAVAAVAGLAMTWWSIRIPIDSRLPLPRPVRWSFVFFVIALLIVSTRLLLRAPNSIPWPLTPALSTTVGLMFLGAAAYFIYALLRPSWTNAAGQLAGFLAYDLVLIVPFLTRLPTVAPEQRLGLTIYTAVVVFSGLLAIYYLFIHGPTRVWRVKALKPSY